MKGWVFATRPHPFALFSKRGHGFVDSFVMARWTLSAYARSRCGGQRGGRDEEVFGTRLPEIVVEGSSVVMLRELHPLHPGHRNVDVEGVVRGATCFLACLLPGREDAWLNFSQEHLPRCWEALRLRMGSGVAWFPSEVSVLLELIKRWEDVVKAGEVMEALGDPGPLRAHEGSLHLLRGYVEDLVGRRLSVSSDEDKAVLHGKMVVLEPPSCWEAEVGASHLEMGWRERRGGVRQRHGGSCLSGITRLFGVVTGKDVPEDVQKAVVREFLESPDADVTERARAVVAASAEVLSTGVAFEIAVRGGRWSAIARQLLRASLDHGPWSTWERSVYETLSSGKGEALSERRRFLVMAGANECGLFIVNALRAVSSTAVWESGEASAPRTRDGPRGGRSRSPSTMSVSRQPRRRRL